MFGPPEVFQSYSPKQQQPKQQQHTQQQQPKQQQVGMQVQQQPQASNTGCSANDGQSTAGSADSL